MKTIQNCAPMANFSHPFCALSPVTAAENSTVNSAQSIAKIIVILTA